MPLHGIRGLERDLRTGRLIHVPYVDPLHPRVLYEISAPPGSPSGGVGLVSQSITPPFKRWGHMQVIGVVVDQTASGGWRTPLGLEARTAIRGSLTAYSTDDNVGYDNFQCAASTGSSAGIEATFATATTFADTQRNLLPVMLAVVRTGAAGDLLVQRTWIGLTSANLNGGDDPVTTHIAAFRYSTGASDGSWICVTKDGTTIKTTASGVSVTANTKYIFQIDMTTVGQVAFYINSVLVATHSVNLPGASTNLGLWGTITTLENVAKNLKLSLYSLVMG